MQAEPPEAQLASATPAVHGDSGEGDIPSPAHQTGDPQTGLQDPAAMLDAIASFLRQYLACDGHQLTVLTLWSVHTWCFGYGPTAAYLSIRSPESQSGKTLCLQLLELLCADSQLITGASTSTVISRLLIHQHRILPDKPFQLPEGTLLLDDCHHTFGPSERQPLLAMLNSGSRATCFYANGRSQYSVFGPKAFAGNAPLPRSLAARCIPIVLERQPPSAAFHRFNFDEAHQAAGHLIEWLEQWAGDHSLAFTQVAQQSPDAMPAALTPREQECAEPLLHIADLIGGSWPGKARVAMSALFNLAESSLSVQLLFDIRACFLVRSNPEYLATRDLLAALTALEYRAWSAWPANSGRRLGALLHPFGIISHDLHRGSEKAFKGYLLQDFQDAFERYLPPLAGRRATGIQSATSSEAEFPLVLNDLRGCADSGMV
ncbi:MAG TPA: DUF3631 domain-containing protein [Candidatus Saccharimonadales bacterium]|nr:DUF3631 domain-containing protein [Candidatus Saccharimonadales bacterium]